MIKQAVKARVPPSVWKQLRRVRAFSERRFQTSLEWAGYTVARKDDYYSPLPSLSRLEARFDRWNRPSALPGIRFDIAEMEARYAQLLSQYLDEFLELPAYEELRRKGFGVGYSALDALTLYMTIRDGKPRRYIEVGSGLSTYYCSLAAKRNAIDGHPLEITCIEPFPFDNLFSIQGIRVVQNEVQDVDLSLFTELQENDVLFIDSTHVLKIDGDVPFLYLEVLPRLNVGVVVHVHDIPFPFNVPSPADYWVLGDTWPILWNEAMVVQAFLAFNDRFRITMSTPLIRHFDEGFLQEHVPLYRSTLKPHRFWSRATPRDVEALHRDAFSSIWLRRDS